MKKVNNKKNFNKKLKKNLELNKLLKNIYFQKRRKKKKINLI